MERCIVDIDHFKTHLKYYCDAFPFLIVVFTPDKTVLGANRSFLSARGLREDQVSGRRCHQVLFESDVPCKKSECTLRSVLFSKMSASRIRTKETPMGRHRYEEITCSPVFGENGEVAYILSTVKDITESKHLEADLKKTKEFLEKIINSSVNAIVAADMTGKVIFMNKSAKDLFGYTDDRIAGRLFATDAYAPEMARKIMERLRSFNHGGVGKLDAMEIEIMTSSGEMIPTEMAASIIYEEGREVATMAIFQDLRPRIAAENRWEKTRMQLVQSEKLASIGRLAAGVAHEINNPLGGIIMYSHLALEELREADPACMNLRKVINQAERCKEIVKGLLDFSRQGEPEFEQVNVNTIIEEILSMVEAQAMFHNIDIEKDLDSYLPPVMGDKSQLQQVFMNLTINAAEAMPDGGRLTIKSSRRNGYIIIRFTDTGCGIRPQDRAKIFEPFFTTKSGKVGTGLGLAVSHGIIARHDGSIAFTSRVNAGTSFIIRLPASWA
ncbi:MAG: PAS domain S-box protein [Deltaproteobacteria bacterium]|nr:PAS domain S-box protein [Deltaproteobacteria bacterium]